MEDSNDKIINVKLSSTTAKLNEKINVCLEISANFGFVNEAKVLINMQNGSNERMINMNYLWTQNNINYFTCNIDFEKTGIHYFCFYLKINEEEKWIKYDKINNSPVLTNDNMQYWYLTAIDENYEVPDWAKGKIMYQIFPDRFYRSKKYNPKKIQGRETKEWGEMPDWNLSPKNKINNTDFFMGNLKGIEEKIPYLNELGVKIIYLNPIMHSQSNHRYDVSNYENIDPYLGTNNSLKSLCNKAHRNGMKVIIDGVFNHTRK